MTIRKALIAAALGCGLLSSATSAAKEIDRTLLR